MTRETAHSAIYRCWWRVRYTAIMWWLAFTRLGGAAVCPFGSDNILKPYRH